MTTALDRAVHPGYVKAGNFQITPHWRNPAITLGELIAKLQSLRSEIKDRDPDAVEVIVINPSARAACDIWESQFTIYVKAFECFPEPPDPNKPEWRKQVRIELADHQPHTGGTTR